MDDKEKLNMLPAVQENPEIALLRMAVDKLGGASGPEVVAAIEKLVALVEHADRRNAEKEFNDAFAQFQSECPPIKKNKSTKGAKESGTSFGYTYSSLDEIDRTVKHPLNKLGFSYNWNATPGPGEKDITCTCTLRHKNGHQVSATFTVPMTKPVASANDIQNHAAILTYVKKQTLVEVLGLTTTDEDTDGTLPSKISEADVKMLRDRLAKSNTTEDKFLKFMQVDKLENIQRSSLPVAILALDKKESSQNRPAELQPEGRLL